MHYFLVAIGAAVFGGFIRLVMRASSADKSRRSLEKAISELNRSGSLLIGARNKLRIDALGFTLHEGSNNQKLVEWQNVKGRFVVDSHRASKWVSYSFLPRRQDVKASLFTRAFSKLRQVFLFRRVPSVRGFDAEELALLLKPAKEKFASH